MQNFFATGRFAIALALFAMPAAASAAETCTDRQVVCFDYCTRQYNGAPRCRDECGRLLAECQSTGCWQSRITAPRCGFERR